MPDVLALLSDTRQRFSLERAIVRLRREGWSGLRTSALFETGAFLRKARRGEGGALLLDPETPGVEPPAEGTLPEALLELRSIRPAVPAAVWASQSWLLPRRILALGTAGVQEVIVRGEDDDPASLARTVLRLLESSRVLPFLEALPSDLSPDLKDLVRALLAAPASYATPDDMARRISRSRSVLFARVKRAGLPPPEELSGWVRTYVVLHLLDSGISVRAAVLEAGFGSPDRFWNTATRRLGAHTREEARSIGWRGLLAAFRNRCLSTEKSVEDECGRLQP